MLMNIEADGWPEWLTTMDHIGSHYPYFISDSCGEFSMHIADLIKEIPVEERKVDPTAVLEVIFSGRPLANRTLIRGINRSPWLATPLKSGWQYHEVPGHANQYRSQTDVTAKLRQLLREELLSYAGAEEKIGLLLSGGLDSRIIAGLLRCLQHDGLIGEVVGLTWGLERSRDVEYARQITDHYSWELRHFSVGPEVVRRNIERTGELGAEFAPYHLHAMPEIREEQDIDVVVAGSYGNSVGRAEYAGDHVTELRSTVPQRMNRYGVLRQGVVKLNKATARGDAYGYRSRIDRTKQYQYREIEQQIHYMRRNLQSCMSHIAEEIPLYQAFTSPDVVELMWGLDPSIRDDRYYVALLEQLPGPLDEVPDPKSGKRPGGSKKVAKSGLSKVYNDYGNWLRSDLRGYITDLVMDLLDRSNLFNETTVYRLLQIWERAETKTTNKIDFLVSWLASFAIFGDRYDVQLIVDDVSDGPTGVLNQIIGPSHALIYQTAREYVRR